MIRFSIITCTYNAAGVLRRTLESVAAQRWPDIEHIVMDGASADGTVVMARDYERAQAGRGVGRTVIVVSEKDKGLYDAMNKALKRATGDYVVFLNAGDVLHSNNTLATIAAVVGSSPLPGVIYGDTHIVDANGNFLRRRRLQSPEQLTWRSFKSGMLVCHQAFYARADIAKAEPYSLSYRYSADVDWCIRVLKKAAGKHLRIANTHAVLVDYLDGGLTADNRLVSLIERFKVMRHHYGMVTTLVMHIWFLIRAVLKQ